MVRKRGLCLVICSIVLTSALQLEAKSPTNRSAKYSSSKGRAPAQSTPGGDSDGEEDVFDPFADFSEFESNPEEEEDINFFKNGRMLTAGLLGGMINYTGEMAQKHQASFRYGIFVSYFFDLHFAAQLQWLGTDSPVSYRSPTTNLVGNSNLSALGFSIKYFLNTQNVTKGLADLNPYFIVGMSSYNRVIRFSKISGSQPDKVMGFNGGMGIEIPMLRKKMFWGAQLTYDLVNFKDENNPFYWEDEFGNPVNYGTSKGDMWTLSGSIGMNF